MKLQPIGSRPRGKCFIALHSIKPAAGATKWTAEHFKRVTGWTGRTNEHARDAALLIIGSKAS